MPGGGRAQRVDIPGRRSRKVEFTGQDGLQGSGLIFKIYSMDEELWFSVGRIETCFLECLLGHLQYGKAVIFWCLSSTRGDHMSVSLLA